MSLIRFVRLIIEYKWLVILLPITLAATIYRLTRNEIREYTSNALLYTGLASGYNIESGGPIKVDNVTVGNAFDNLFNTMKSKSTMDEVGLRLLANHLILKEPNPNVANAYTLGKLKEVLTDSDIKKLVDYSSFDKTLKNVQEDIKRDDSKIYNYLMTSEKGIYSGMGILSRFGVARQNSSDMVTISYSANDPAVVKQTLEIIIKVVTDRYKSLKVNETGNVVAYFEEQLRRVGDKLKNSEDNLTDFSSRNKIINYYEQTKIVAVKEADLEERINALVSDIESSRAVLRDLDTKLGLREDLIAKSRRFSALRDSINLYTTRLTLMEFDSTPREQAIEQIKRKLTELEEKLKQGMLDYYYVNNSKNGIPNKMYFGEWIAAVINIDKTQARLLILKDVKRSFDEKYDRLAPLGSTVSRYEREIGVIEKEYLTILGSLNTSRIREQNLMMSTNLRVIDEVKMPTKPEPSKRNSLIVAGFMAGFILSLGFIVGKEFADKSLKMPTLAEKQIGIPFVGALPLVDPQQHEILFNVIETYTLNQAISRIKKLSSDIAEHPQLVIVCSTRRSEGKSYFISKLCARINDGGSRAVWLNPHDFSEDFAFTYQLKPSFVSASLVEDLVENEDFSDCEYIFLELPPLISHPIPVNLVRKAAFTLLLADATRVWDVADKYMFQTYTESTSRPIGLLLNKVKHDFLEGIIGEIPKVRSWFRRKFKSLVLRKRESKNTNIKLKHELLKHEEEKAWFNETGLSDLVELKAAPEVTSYLEESQKPKSISYYRVKVRRRMRILRGLTTVIIGGTVLFSSLYLFWRTTPESKFEKFSDFLLGNKMDSLARAKVSSPAIDPNQVIDPQELDNLPPKIIHDSVKKHRETLEQQPSDSTKSPTKTSDNWDTPTTVKPTSAKAVVPNKPVVQVAKPVALPSEQAKYRLYGGVFKSKENAQKQVQAFKKAGIDAQIAESQGSSGVLYKVCVGKFEQKNVADKKAQEITQKTNTNIIVLEN